MQTFEPISSECSISFLIWSDVYFHWPQSLHIGKQGLITFVFGISWCPIHNPTWQEYLRVYASLYKKKFVCAHYTNTLNYWLPIARMEDGQERRTDWGRRDLISTALQVSALLRIRIHLEFTLLIICLSSPWSLAAAFAWILVKTMLGEGEDTLPC